MATEVILPRVDMDMTEGRIAKWHLGEGDQVAEGQPLFEIETDKAAMEVEAPASGVLRGVAAQPGDTVPIGTPVAWVCAPDEDFTPPGAGSAAAGPPGEPEAATSPADSATAPADAATATDAAAPQAPTPTSAPTSARGDTPRATPLARRYARLHDIDLRQVDGQGPRGRVQRADIERVLARGGVEEPAAAPASSGVAARDAITLRTLREGSGDPLVLLHGFGADATAWRAFLGHLGVRNPLLALDLPGHGRGAGVTVADFDELVAGIESILTGVGIQRLHLCGHSLGGAVAAALAGRDGLDLRSLSLLAPAGLGPEIDGPFIEGFCRATQATTLRAWMTRLVHDPAALPDAMVRAAVEAHGDAAIRDGHARLARTLFPQGTQVFSVRAYLARYAGPCRVIWGRDDQILPVRQAEALPGRVALHRFAGTGHLPQVEAPAAVAALLDQSVRSAG